MKNHKEDEDSEAPPAKRASQSPMKVPRRSCQFYIEHKSRSCYGPAMNSSEFCAEHSSNEGLSPESPYYRVICPYNPKHTCFGRKLKQHMRCCNDRPRAHEPYFMNDLNTTSEKNDPEVLVGKTLVQLSDEEMMDLIKKIDEVYNALVPKMENKAGSFLTPEMRIILKDELFGRHIKRHLEQNSAILHLLKTSGLLKESTCFVEFGSGKGGLTYWLAKTLEQLGSNKDCHFLLVDRESLRHKRDNKLDKLQFSVERVLIDIKDLKLDVISGARDAKNLVGICKHLCGDGTDMALRCLMETNSTAEKNLAGLVMATCCHHRCKWGSYVGQPFVKEWGIEEKDFKPMTCLTSWAVCGTGRSGFSHYDIHIPDESLTVPFTAPFTGTSQLSTEERRIAGYKAKQILDYGRCCFVRRHLENTHLTAFIKSEETLENIAIVGSRSEASCT